MVNAAPTAVHLGGSCSVVPCIDKLFAVFKSGVNHPFAFKVHPSPIARSGFTYRIEPMAQFLLVVPFIAGTFSLTREGENVFRQPFAGGTDCGPETVQFAGCIFACIVGKMRCAVVYGFYRPFAGIVHPTPHACFNVGYGEAPLTNRSEEHT